MMASGVAECPDCVGAFDDVYDAAWTRRPRDVGAHTAGGRQLRRLVEREDYDIVHMHTPIAAFAGRWALRDCRSGPARIYTAHGFHFHEEGHWLLNSLYLSLEKLAGRWTDELVVMNAADCRAAREHHLVPSERVWNMPGIGVDLNHWNAEAASEGAVASIRAELGLPDDGQLVLVVGALNPDKRQIDALQAVAMLPRTDIHLAFAGSGPLADSLGEEANRLGIASRTHFLGYRSDVRDLLLASTASLHPSVREGLPRAIMESMAMGVPSIAADVRGNRDLLKGGAGLLAPPYDVRALASHVEAVVDNAAVRDTLVNRATERIEDYDLTGVLQQHEELYRVALNR